MNVLKLYTIDGTFVDKFTLSKHIPNWNSPTGRVLRVHQLAALNTNGYYTKKQLKTVRKKLAEFNKQKGELYDAMTDVIKLK